MFNVGLNVKYGFSNVWVVVGFFCVIMVLFINLVYCICRSRLVCLNCFLGICLFYVGLLLGFGSIMYFFDYIVKLVYIVLEFEVVSDIFLFSGVVKRNVFIFLELFWKNVVSN